MRVKQPENSKDLPRITNLDDRVRILNNRDPLFDYFPVPGDARRINIQPVKSQQSGFDLIRIPFRPPVASGVALPYEVLSDLTYVLDFDNTGLADGDGTVGGLIDGIALAANTDYLVWAFLTKALNGSIEGIGITTRPRVTGVTMPNPSALGGSVVITVGTDQGNRFAVGARVLCRNGTTGEVNGAAGSLWNQGIITATAANTISVTLDASWGLSVNNNTAMNGTTSVEIFQLDNFQPRLGGETDSYNDGQPYAYLGMLRSDSSSNLDWYRHRGDLYPLLGVFDAIVRTGITASEPFQIGLGRYIPLGTKHASMTLFTALTAGTPGNATLNISSSGTTTQASARSVVSAGDFLEDIITIRGRDASINGSYVEGGTITASWITRIAGYIEENW